MQTLAAGPSAALQLNQTGHSSIAQHFRRVKVGSADGTVVGEPIEDMLVAAVPKHRLQDYKRAQLEGFGETLLGGTTRWQYYQPIRRTALEYMLLVPFSQG
ncbi:MAG: hypothetical protein OQK00_07285 [Rhodobacteraceae bacterium]|nr:hypothetical protein [Paracoccaceae bacterium]MCW9042241.1 hypothetical protein [Pseudopelagicola sp.]